MNIRNKNKTAIFIIIISSFLLSFLLFFVFQNFFNIWNIQVNDLLFKIKYKVKGKEKTSPYIIHLDVNDSILEKYKPLINDRALFVDIIDVLNKANVNSIIFDIIFEGNKNEYYDTKLVEAAKKSKKVYCPIIPVFSEYRNINKPDIKKEDNEILKKSLIYPIIKNKGEPLEAYSFISTFHELAVQSKGIGYVSITSDIDGVYRRLPLLCGYKNGYFLSLPFRAACDYLKVNYSDIEVVFGKKITLKNAKFPSGLEKDIEIPIDKQGRMIINYAGLWNDSFTHYNFEKTLKAKNDDVLFREVRDILEDFIVLISDITTMNKDFGAVPLENIYPLIGIQSNVINSILTENFISPLSFFENLVINLILIFTLWILAVKFRTFYFSTFSAVVYSIFLIFNVLIFLYFNKTVNFLTPSIGFFLSYVFVILSFSDSLRKKAERQLENFLLVLSSAIESKDKYTGGHVERVAKYSRDLAVKYGMKGHKLRSLYLGAMVHDAGKIGVKESILNKPGKLNSEELKMLQHHTNEGKVLLSKIEDVEIASSIAYCHQERFDGKGYPQGLKGEDIPIEARIVTIADYWDAITTDRPYRKAMPLKNAIKIMREERGNAFDPNLFDLFMDKKDKLYLKYIDQKKLEELKK